MSADTLTALAAVIAAAGAIVTGILSFLNRKAARDAADRALLAKEAAEASQTAIVRTEQGVFELGRQIDGRLSELLKTTADLARAEGLASGKEQAGRP